MQDVDVTDRIATLKEHISHKNWGMLNNGDVLAFQRVTTLVSGLQRKRLHEISHETGRDILNCADIIDKEFADWGGILVPVKVDDNDFIEAALLNGCNVWPYVYRERDKRLAIWSYLKKNLYYERVRYALIHMAQKNTDKEEILEIWSSSYVLNKRDPVTRLLPQPLLTSDFQYRPGALERNTYEYKELSPLENPLVYFPITIFRKLEALYLGLESDKDLGIIDGSEGVIDRSLLKLDFQDLERAVIRAKCIEDITVNLVKTVITKLRTRKIPDTVVAHLIFKGITPYPALWEHGETYTVERIWGRLFDKCGWHEKYAPILEELERLYYLAKERYAGFRAIRGLSQAQIDELKDRRIPLKVE